MRIISASDLTSALSAPAPRTVELAFAGVVAERLSIPAGTTLRRCVGSRPLKDIQQTGAGGAADVRATQERTVEKIVAA